MCARPASTVKSVGVTHDRLACSRRQGFPTGMPLSAYSCTSGSVILAEGLVPVFRGRQRTGAAHGIGTGVSPEVPLPGRSGTGRSCAGHGGRWLCHGAGRIR